MKISILALSAMALAATAASAADVKTPLACKLGAASPSQLVVVTNTTKGALKTDTSINFVVNTKQGSIPGQVHTCFALDAPLAAKASISHDVPIGAGQTPLNCTAFLSSIQPSRVRSPDGSSSLTCDGS